MAPRTKKTKDFIPMERTRAMLSEAWDHWRNTLGHTPDMAKKMLTGAIKDLHKSEVASLKKLKTKKRAVKKAVKKSVTKKLKVAKRKVK